ncbi:MAG: hypothetical protein KAR87_00315 [Candidatus Aenigmarchaeota archaeon]|nr:hypothetical protein [Candidatus Aenigmarchaeota archaeon]
MEINYSEQVSGTLNPGIKKTHGVIKMVVKQLYNGLVKQKSILAMLVFAGLFLFCIQVNVGYAEEEQFRISLDCYNSCDGKEDVNYSEEIMFVLTIQNKLEYWISVGGETGVDLYITVENAKLYDGKNEETYKNVLGKNFFLEPDSIRKIYIPFNIYNRIEEENSRLGDWKITPELKIKEVLYYKNPFETKNIQTYNNKQLAIPRLVKGNVLKFEVIKPGIERLEDKVRLSDNFLEKPLNKEFIIPVGVEVFAKLIWALPLLIYGVYRYFKKKKRR